jgi:hypothetical protein
MSWDDSDATEWDARDYAKAVASALDNSGALHNPENYYQVGAAQCTNYEPRMFGSILVHYIRITVDVTEYLT